MQNNLIAIKSLIAIAVWTITIVLIVAYYFGFLAGFYSVFNLRYFNFFLVISFAMPFVLCKILDKLLRNFGYIVKGTASILVVFLVGSLCLILWNDLQSSVVFPSQDFPTRQKPFFDNLLEFPVLWILVVTAYYGIQSGQKWLSKTNTKSRDLESDLSFVDFGNEEFYKKLNTPPKAAALAAGLHRRSNLLTNQANTVLVIIIVVLLVTAVFVVFAGQISGWGTKPINHLSNMITERNWFSNQIFKHRERLEEIEHMIVGTKDEQAPSDERAVELENLKRQQINTRKQIEELLIQELSLDKTIQNIRTSLIKRESGSDTDQTQSDTNILAQLLLAAGITRFGVVIIAIYLVQILSNLYRYNVQSAAHYRAIVDFLILANPKDYEKIKALDGALLPDTSFSKTPNMISQKITKSVVEAIENIIPKLRRSVEKSLKKSKKSKKSKQPRDFED